MTTAQSFRFPYERSAYILRGMTADLSPTDWLHHPCDGANCAAWIVGHLIAVEHSALKYFTDAPPALPDADFAARHGKGAKPGADFDYGDVTKLMPLFDTQRKLMIELISPLPDEAFDRPIEHPMFEGLGQLAGLIPVHTTLHCGQISTIRRSLGRPALF